MTLEQALKIVDPDTCHEALAPYAGDCDMLHAKASEACRMVADAYRAVKAERDAAVRDLVAEFNRRNPFEPGQNIFVVARDENGDPCGASGYMYIASAAGCIIVSPYINDIERLDLTMAELAEETAEDYSCSLSVFPEDDCFSTLEEAQQMIQDWAETEGAD